MIIYLCVKFHYSLDGNFRNPAYRKLGPFFFGGGGSPGTTLQRVPREGCSKNLHGNNYETAVDCSKFCMRMDISKGTLGLGQIRYVLFRAHVHAPFEYGTPA